MKQKGWLTRKKQPPSKLKTILPASIQTASDAAIFLTDLYNNNESYHPEDDANDLVGLNITQNETEKLNSLMDDIYKLPGNEDNMNMAFDPCGFLLSLDPDYSIENN